MKPYGTRSPTQGGHKTHGHECALCAPHDVQPKRARREGKKDAESGEHRREEGA